MSVGILAVDDSGYMRNRIKMILGDDVTVVAEASDGVEAVKTYEKRGDEIDLVLMDIIMEKANGVKATSAIKQLDPEVSVIMCTSVGQYEKMKLAAKAGADGYVTKPFDRAELLEAIESVSA
ncbi:response regulator [Natrinema longum]|uniref:Response regulator n=1 Tax=Natrinema longum TaxID=370324 RepID=A0A8A2U6P6_9EURY|nr:response regulator [Natrinema longum]MBZ6494598.1 response regulator [Natrinema longum]QSW84082.1 response regulator [Natrinema longum]